MDLIYPFSLCSFSYIFDEVFLCEMCYIRKKSFPSLLYKISRREKYGIPDLRTFFESDTRWLKHYGFSAFDIPSLVAGL